MRGFSFEHLKPFGSRELEEYWHGETQIQGNLFSSDCQRILGQILMHECTTSLWPGQYKIWTADYGLRTTDYGLWRVDDVKISNTKLNGDLPK